MLERPLSGKPNVCCGLRTLGQAVVTGRSVREPGAGPRAGLCTRSLSARLGGAAVPSGAVLARVMPAHPLPPRRPYTGPLAVRFSTPPRPSGSSESAVLSFIETEQVDALRAARPEAREEDARRERRSAGERRVTTRATLTPG